MGATHPSGRTVLEWTLTVGGFLIAAVVITAMDTRIRSYAAEAFATGDTGLHVPQQVSYLVRVTVDLCRDHQPLAAFVAVGFLLVVFMRQMR